MFRLLKNFLLFTPYERRGILLLILLIVLTIGGGWWWRSYQTRQPAEGRIDSLISHFSDSLQAATAVTENRVGKQLPEAPQSGGDTLFAFNPNDADSATLVRLGFTPWMARNLLKYRAKGGHFRRTEDLRKLYGMTDTLYTRLAPYVTIPPAEEQTERYKHEDAKPSRPTQEAHPSVYLPRTDSLYTRVEKYPKGTRIELNRCDTSELKKIPGIGSYTARRIVDYRGKLGGFVRLEQLREIRLNNEVLEPWFTLDSTAVSPLQVNRLPMKQLLTHPYLNYRQSKAIMQYRERHGTIPSIEVMRSWEEFTANELRRVAPYLNFE